MRTFKYFLVIFIFLSLAGCYTLEARRQGWISYYSEKIGTVQYLPFKTSPNMLDIYVDTKSLINGNEEVEFIFFKSQGGCHFFYEYKKNSGLIVGFRFEENSKYDCNSGV